MLTVFLSWLLVALMMIVTSWLNASVEVTFYVPLYSGITVNISCAANFYILFFFSNDYRNAFKSQLQSIFKIKFEKMETITNSSILPAKSIGQNEITKVT